MFCYAARIYRRYGKGFTPQFRSYALKDKMPDDGSWIFVGSMGDTFCKEMQDSWILQLLTFIENCEADNKFLLQTKNPERFLDLYPQLEKIKDKVILGTTLETTGDTPWSTAPRTNQRAVALMQMKLKGFKTFLSLEPLSDFDLERMCGWIMDITPEAVEVGLENYTRFTTPPTFKKIRQLLALMDKYKIHYVLKENLEHLYDSSMETKIDGGEK